MKSKRAEEKIEYFSNAGRGIDGLTELECCEVVQLAEWDAEKRDRDRAVRAYCSIAMCDDLALGFCPKMDGQDRPCRKHEAFCKAYDNENRTDDHGAGG